MEGRLLKLDLIHPVAFVGTVLFPGYGLRRLIKLLSRCNIPAPVIGAFFIGLTNALGITVFLNVFK